MAHDDEPEGLIAPDFSAEEAEESRHTPIRTCILTRRQAPREELVRLALGPDGTVAPDVRAKAPGRGAWIGCDRPTLEAAQKKGKLKGALSRAFKTGQVTVPDDLPARIAAALERAALDRLGLEARAGQLVTGSEKIVDQARRGAVHLLLHAADAAEDGTRRLEQALRVGLDGDEDRAARGLVLPVGRAILSMALGRENVVHAALVAPAAAARVGHALKRWRDFIGLDGSSDHGTGAGPAEAPRASGDGGSSGP